MVRDDAFILDRAFQVKTGDKEVHEEKVSHPVPPDSVQISWLSACVLSTASVTLLSYILGHWQCCRELH